MPTPRHPLHDQALLLREEGLSYDKISILLGLQRPTIVKWCVLDGGVSRPAPGLKEDQRIYD